MGLRAPPTKEERERGETIPVEHAEMIERAFGGTTMKFLFKPSIAKEVKVRKMFIEHAPKCRDCGKKLLTRKYFTEREWKRLMWGPPGRRNEIAVPIFLCKKCKIRRIKQEIALYKSRVQMLTEQLKRLEK